MRSAAVLALLLCAGQAMALPVNGPMNKRDTEVMKCIVEVISDTLAKPGPMPVSQECSETLRGDERILSIMRHQNLLTELQDLALQGAKERARAQKKHGSFEEELSEVLGQQNDQAELREGTEETPSKDAEKRGDSNEVEKSGEDTDRAGPQAPPELGQGSQDKEDSQVPEEEEGVANTHPLASLPGQKHTGPPPEGDSEGPSRDVGGREKGQDAEQGQQARREEEEDDEEKEEEEEAGEKVLSEEEGPTGAADPHPSLGYQEVRGAESWSRDGAGEPGAEDARAPEGQRDPAPARPEEEPAGAPGGLLPPGGKSGEPEPEPEPEDARLSEEWEAARRWSRMDRLGPELTAEKRPEAADEDDPDRSMKLSFRPRGYGFRRGWRPSSQEDPEGGLAAQGRSYPEEKKEEEGSANRRLEDQELESLSAIEAELEKVARQLQALRRG